MVDRTKDFLALAGDALTKLPLKATIPATQPTPNTSSPPTPPSGITRTQQAIFFNQRAAEVSQGIHHCSVYSLD